MKQLLTIILLLSGLKSFSCECYNSPPRKAIDSYHDILVANIKSGIATVIKTWKGNLKIGSTFQYSFEKHDCALYSLVDSGAYLFFMNSVADKYCNVTEPYYNYMDIEYLDKTYKTSISKSLDYSQFLDSLEYERKFVVYGNGRHDIKDKKAIFVQRHRFLKWFTRFTIEDFNDIDRQVGFYSTNFYLIDKNYKSKYCQYDYVFWVTNSHLRYKVTDQIDRRIKRKIKKACSKQLV